MSKSTTAAISKKNMERVKKIASELGLAFCSFDDAETKILDLAEQKIAEMKALEVAV